MPLKTCLILAFSGDPAAVNATDRIDTVVIESEILFGGKNNEPSPKLEVDNFMAANIDKLEWVAELGLSRGDTDTFFF